MEPAFVTIPLDEYQQLVTAVQAISKLRDEVGSLKDEISILNDRIKVLEERQTEDNSNLHREIALDRQRITRLEHPEPEQRNLDRGQVLKSLIVTNGGKLSRKEARKLMRLSESQFSQLLAASKDFIEISPSKLDSRIKILRLK